MISFWEVYFKCFRQGDRAMSFPLEEPSGLTSSLVEEGRVEGIFLSKKRELTIPPAPFDEGE
jgi:hypothetical protein